MDDRSRFLTHAERVREPLTAYCRRLLWNGSDLNDALQTTLLTAFQKFSDFEEGTDFRAWVFRIATLTVFNLNRRGTDTAPLPEPEQISAEAELEREYAYDEILREPDRLMGALDDELARALKALPEPERAALLLMSVGAFKCREAADLLGMPIGSVMGYLARARGKLRERLAEYARSRGIPGRVS